MVMDACDRFSGSVEEWSNEGCGMVEGVPIARA